LSISGCSTVPPRRAIDTAEIPRLDEIEGWPLPEEQTEWLGAPSAERILRDAYVGGRMHHAWLLGGPKGIGKATLAYRFARFALAYPDPKAAANAPSGLGIPGDHPVFRKVAARGHPNLMTLARPWDEKNKRYRTELIVDEVRRLIPFFGSTAAESGWRIVIVDSADEMNASAANALLKLLEEPPTRSLFLVLSHTPGRLLPTIRSRCRSLPLSGIAPEKIAGVLAEGEQEGDTADFSLAARLSGGSLRRAIHLVEGEGIELYRDLLRLTANLPSLDIPAVHGLADRVSRRGDDDAYFTLLDLIRDWLQRRVRREPEIEARPPLSPAVLGAPLARWAEVWEKAEEASGVAEELNLDRKQVILTIFMNLARATRM
jgi:DNA polymerase-3 subunit delta'